MRVHELNGAAENHEMFWQCFGCDCCSYNLHHQVLVWECFDLGDETALVATLNYRLYCVPPITSSDLRAFIDARTAVIGLFLSANQVGL